MGKLTLFMHEVRGVDASFDVKEIRVLHIIISSLITRSSLQGLYCLNNVKNGQKDTKKWEK